MVGLTRFGGENIIRPRWNGKGSLNPFTVKALGDSPRKTEQEMSNGVER